MRYSWLIIFVLILGSCHSGKKIAKKSTPSKSVARILKNPDPAFKLRMAEQFFVNKRYSRAQQVFEDVMPYYKTTKEFEDIYYKYASNLFWQLS